MLNRSEEPGSGKSQWYGDEAERYPETKTRWLSELEPAQPDSGDEPAGRRPANAEHDPERDATETAAEDASETAPEPASSPLTTRQDLPTAKAEPEPEPEAEPVGYGQDGPPPPFVDRPEVKEGPPPPFQKPPTPLQEEPPSEDLVLDKPLVLPPAAYELPRTPQPEQSYAAPPYPQPAYQQQTPAYPAPTMHRPGHWHRLHTPVGVFLVAFGLTGTVNAILRWTDHRAEIASLLDQTAGSVAGSAGTILVGVHVVEALLLLIALVGLLRRRSVWYLPAIFGWMAGFGVFAGLDIWAGHLGRLTEHAAYLGGFTILLFLSYALGVKARVNSSRTAAAGPAAAAYDNRPLTRTQELALAALNNWQRRQSHPG